MNLLISLLCFSFWLIKKIDLTPILMGNSTVPNSGCKFAINKDGYEINDVTLEFSIGLYDPKRQVIACRESITLLFSNDRWLDYTMPLDLTDPHFIREIDPNEFFSEEYRYKPHTIFNCDCSQSEDIYNHSEKITIPKEAFNKKTGIIIFWVKVDLWDDENYFIDSHYYYDDLSVNIYYKVNGDKVVISDRQFQ